MPDRACPLVSSHVGDCGCSPQRPRRPCGRRAPPRVQRDLAARPQDLQAHVPTWTGTLRIGCHGGNTPRDLSTQSAVPEDCDPSG